MTLDDATAQFEAHRRYLRGLAYRMLGSVAEAEDVVQDAFLRWTAADRERVAEPRAFLSRIVTRLALDRLKSARAQREQYVGTWLPEPVVDGHDPIETIALADDLSVALLVALERLSPLERAAFLLHDVFDMEFEQVADVLDRSEAAVRQLAARAREHVRQGRARYDGSADAARIADAFATAMVSGDVDALAKLLAADAVFYSDGGGKRAAALNPIYGRDKIVRFIIGVTRKRGGIPDASTVERATINRLPGFVLHSPDGVETLALEVAGEHIVAIYAVRNPDKLRHLS
ncbi:MAG TPA: sigma-70 family RNA polymerase sigma factor [Kofleriaceae bacterium]|nr:sigma-70 family RNA polymerase sigma factor [Kofleriaceae bacterium]